MQIGRSTLAFGIAAVAGISVATQATAQPETDGIATLVAPCFDETGMSDPIAANFLAAGWTAALRPAERLAVVRAVGETRYAAQRMAPRPTTTAEAAETLRTMHASMEYTARAAWVLMFFRDDAYAYVEPAFAYDDHWDGLNCMVVGRDLEGVAEALDADPATMDRFGDAPLAVRVAPEIVIDGIDPASFPDLRVAALELTFDAPPSKPFLAPTGIFVTYRGIRP